MKSRLIFITGTDTGVGKTLLTGLLLHHLRQSGCHALAMKPFCSGGTADVDLLHSLQDGELSRSEINPYYFREPIAPLLAARIHRRQVRLPDVVKKIERVRRLLQPSPLATRHSSLLLEGSGGLLVPLGEGYAVGDLIAELSCEVIVASRNRLGTINHTLMTVRILQDIGIHRLTVVMMGSSSSHAARSTHLSRRSRSQAEHATRSRDPSVRTNLTLLAELLSPLPVIEIPYLGPNPLAISAVKKNCKKIKKTLARILE